MVTLNTTVLLMQDRHFTLVISNCFLIPGGLGQRKRLLSVLPGLLVLPLALVG